MFKIDAIHIAELMIGLYDKRGGGYSQKEALKFLIKHVKQCKCQKKDEFFLWRNINKWDEEFEDEIYTEDNYDIPIVYGEKYSLVYGEKYSFDELIMNLLEKYCGL